MKELTYWINKLSFIFMMFFLTTTTWILTHPIETLVDGTLVYPSVILWHIVALFIFMPAAYISHIAYKDWDES